MLKICVTMAKHGSLGKVFGGEEIGEQIENLFPLEQRVFLPEDVVVIQRLLEIKGVPHGPSLNFDGMTLELCLNFDRKENHETGKKFVAFSYFKMLFHFGVGAYKNLYEFNDLEVKKINMDLAVVKTATKGCFGASRKNPWVCIPLRHKIFRQNLFWFSYDMELSLWNWFLASCSDYRLSRPSQEDNILSGMV